MIDLSIPRFIFKKGKWNNGHIRLQFVFMPFMHITIIVEY